MSGALRRGPPNIDTIFAPRYETQPGAARGGANNIFPRMPGRHDELDEGAEA
jgi:hypothetical protein